jgi:hypothetical protein
LTLHGSAADPDPACHFDADPDPTFHFAAVPDPDPGLQVKAQNLEKVLKYGYFPYILACHLQIDAYPDPAYHVRILPFNLMRIRIHNTAAWALKSCFPLVSKLPPQKLRHTERFTNVPVIVIIQLCLTSHI